MRISIMPHVTAIFVARGDYPRIKLGEKYYCPTELRINGNSESSCLAKLEKAITDCLKAQTVDEQRACDYKRIVVTYRKGSSLADSVSFTEAIYHGTYSITYNPSSLPGATT